MRWVYRETNETQTSGPLTCTGSFQVPVLKIKILTTHRFSSASTLPITLVSVSSKLCFTSLPKSIHVPIMNVRVKKGKMNPVTLASILRLDVLKTVSLIIWGSMECHIMTILVTANN